MADGVDEPGNAAESVQAATGQVGDMRHPAERHQMVRADAVDGDAADDDHVLAVVVKTVAERFGRVEVVAAEQAFLPEFAHALCRAAHVRGIGGDSAGRQQIAYRLFKCKGVKLSGPRNADAGG